MSGNCADLPSGARRRLIRAAGPLLLGLATPWRRAWAFDPDYREWQALLERHVSWNAAGTASSVDYRGFARDRNRLDAVLRAFSALGEPEYLAFGRDRRLAFLINAYNAFTIDLVLGKYPNLESIKDLGSLFRTPWQQRFFRLLGAQRSLDDVEHGMIRAPGVFDEPRIHFALVCASVGCPALRPEAWRADRLEHQLEDSVARFLSDRSRNRYDARSGALEVSRLFDWYGEDFTRGARGFGSVAGFLAKHAALLASSPDAVARIRARQAPIRFLDYDWSLNDRR